jgi:hypothetical protein
MGSQKPVRPFFVLFEKFQGLNLMPWTSCEKHRIASVASAKLGNGHIGQKPDDPPRILPRQLHGIVISCNPNPGKKEKEEPVRRKTDVCS